MLVSALIAIALYVSTLFYVAWWADRRGPMHGHGRRTGLIYGLSLGVYFTSWTFLGAVGTAARSGWDYLPIYLGPLLLMTVGFKLVRRMIHLGRTFHSTSIADFISTRYGKSGGLAALVTLIAVVGTIPYIALQLRSVSMSLSAVAGEGATGGYDLVPLIAVGLAVFAVLFGTRHVDTTVHKRGLVAAVSLESALKLLALLVVAGFALIAFPVAASPMNMFTEGSPFAVGIGDRFFTLTVISMAAILCLPRQFHVMVVECQRDEDVRTGRNVFIVSLLITIIVVIPITLVGVEGHLKGSPDLYVLTLPLTAGADWLTVLVFLGGFSAATGMVIVSTVALSTMVTNDLLFGTLLRRRRAGSADDIVGGQAHVLVRRIVIFGLLALATLYHLGVQESNALASLGILSFAAVTQFVPALVGGLYWKRGHKTGVVLGLAAGFTGWLFLLMLPLYLGEAGPLEIPGVDSLTSGVLIATSLNILFYIGGSYAAEPAVVDRIQAAAFVDARARAGSSDNERGQVTMVDLRALMERCLGRRQALDALAAFEEVDGEYLPVSGLAAPRVIAFAERKIAGVLGNASARILMRSVMTGSDVGLEDIATVLGETQEKLQFSQELLQSTLDNMSQSVSVVDKNLRLIAWNQRYVDLFEFPAGFLKVGQSIADVIQFNAQRGVFGSDENELKEFVERRMAQLKARNHHQFERTYRDGRTLSIVGSPMPGGNYVTTFTDVTENKRIEHELKLMNETLEERVNERTSALNEANAALQEATRSKTRFLAAASHDLLQPLNAARLFASALKEELTESKDVEAGALMDKLDQSIQSADKLLRALLDISKLDAGGLQPTIAPFNLNDVIRNVVNDQAMQAAGKGLKLKYVPLEAVVMSDKGLVISVLQNLISNAVRYTAEGRVLVGVRRRGKRLAVQVWDTGPGMSADEQKEVFKEFVQLPQGGRDAGAKGLGLGLAITERIATLLGLDLAVQSVPGKGSMFEISLEVSDAAVPAKEEARIVVGSLLSGLKVLCIDNDRQVLDGQKSLLTRWGCDVSLARSATEAASLFEAGEKVPELVLLDYQLDDGATGPAAYEELALRWGERPPVIMITADRQLPDGALPDERWPVLHKPVEPAVLRAAIDRTVKTWRSD